MSITNQQRPRTRRGRPRKKADRIADGLTQFGRWRQLVGLTQEEAAALLGLSLRRIGEYDQGSATPKLCARIVMAAHRQGVELPEPWPEK